VVQGIFLWERLNVITVVFGRVGDGVQWPVRGFSDRTKAEALALALTSAAKKYHEEYGAHAERVDWNGPDRELTHSRFKIWNESTKAALRIADPGFQCSGGVLTDYFTAEVETSIES
jgi:predicted DNA-binding WGR domain protein